MLRADAVARQGHPRVHGRLLDRRPDNRLLVEVVAAPGGSEGAREVHACARVVGVRLVTHDAGRERRADRRRRGRRPSRWRTSRRSPPRGARCRLTRTSAAVEQNVADVGRVELLLAIRGARSGTDPHAFVAGDDATDEPALPGDAGLRAGRCTRGISRRRRNSRPGCTYRRNARAFSRSTAAGAGADELPAFWTDHPPASREAARIPR